MQTQKKFSIFASGVNDYNQISIDSDGSMPFPIEKIDQFSTYYEHSILVNNNGAACSIGNNKGNQISANAGKKNQWNIINIKRINKILSAVCGSCYTLYLTTSDSPRKLVLFWQNANCGKPFTVNQDLAIKIYGGDKIAVSIASDRSVLIFSELMAMTNYYYHKPFTLKLPSIPDGVACLDNSVIFLCKNILYEASLDKIKDNKPVLTQINFNIGQRIDHISGTFQHCFIVTESGQVFARGDNSTGKLGVGKNIKKLNDFVNVSTLSKRKIVKAFAGYNHSLFIDDKGAVYSCGENKNGSLLLKTKNDDCCVYTPRLTKINSGAISCIAGRDISVVFGDFDEDIVNDANDEAEAVGDREGDGKKKIKDANEKAIDNENSNKSSIIDDKEEGTDSQEEEKDENYNSDDDIEHKKKGIKSKKILRKEDEDYNNDDAVEHKKKGIKGEKIITKDDEDEDYNIDDAAEHKKKGKKNFRKDDEDYNNDDAVEHKKKGIKGKKNIIKDDEDEDYNSDDAAEHKKKGIKSNKILRKDDDDIFDDFLSEIKSEMKQIQETIDDQNDELDQFLNDQNENANLFSQFVCSVTGSKAPPSKSSNEDDDETQKHKSKAREMNENSSDSDENDVESLNTHRNTRPYKPFGQGHQINNAESNSSTYQPKSGFVAKNGDKTRYRPQNAGHACYAPPQNAADKLPNGHKYTPAYTTKKAYAPPPSSYFNRNQSPP